MDLIDFTEVDLGPSLQIIVFAFCDFSSVWLQNDGRLNEILTNVHLSGR